VNSFTEAGTKHFVKNTEKKTFTTWVPGLHTDPTFKSPSGDLTIEKVNEADLDPSVIKDLKDGEVIEKVLEEE